MSKLPGGITGKGFQPGRSGNPGGRPKDRSITARLRRALEGDKLGGKTLPEGQTVLDLIVEAILLEASRGNSKVIKEVLDRVEGKVAAAAPEVDEFANIDVRELTDAELLALIEGQGGGGTGAAAEDSAGDLRDLAPRGEPGASVGLAAPAADQGQA